MRTILLNLILPMVFICFTCLSPRGESAATPLVAKSLTAEHTIGLLSIERIDQWGLLSIERIDQWVLGILKEIRAQPKHLKSQLPAIISDLNLLKETLSFDPTTSVGWASTGLDSTAGLSIVFDAQMYQQGSPSPIILLKVTDEVQLLSTLEKWTGQAPQFRPSEGGLRELEVKDKTFWVTRRGAYTAFMIKPRHHLEESKKSLIAFGRREGESLEETKIFRDTFRGVTSEHLLGYLSLLKARPLLKRSPLFRHKEELLDFYLDLFPSFGGALSQESVHLQLMANARGVAALKQIFQPQKTASMTRYLPQRGWMLARASFNLAELFNGLIALTHPSQKRALAALAQLKAPLSAKLGMPWDDLAKGLGGHILIGAKLASLPSMKTRGPAAINWLLALNVDDPSMGAQALEALTTLITKRGATRSPVKVAGHAGVQLQVGPLSVIAVRADKAILVAPSIEGIQAALKTAQSENLSALNVGALLDLKSSFHGYAVDMGALIELFEHFNLKMGEGEQAMVKNVLAQTLGDQLREVPVSAYVLQIDQGIKLSGIVGTMNIALLGVLSAIAIPSFIKYQHRAKTAEVRVNIDRISQAAIVYYLESSSNQKGEPTAQHFPSSAPLMPAHIKEAFCASGTHKMYKSSPEERSHPVWETLSFQPHGQLFAYEFISSGSKRDARFTVRAVGDLDCDGVYSTFEQVGIIDSEGMVTLQPLTVNNPLE